MGNESGNDQGNESGNDPGDAPPRPDRAPRIEEEDPWVRAERELRAERAREIARPPVGLQPSQGFSATEVVTFTAALVGWIALDTATHGVARALLSIPGPGNPDDAYGREPVIPADLHLTAPPQQGHDGLVPCTLCQRRVPYAAMTLDENGYFCRQCGTL